MQEKHKITINMDGKELFGGEMYTDCIYYLNYFAKDLCDSITPQVSCIPIVKEFQKTRGTIVNSWLLCSILNDEKQYLTESDRKALIRLMKRIEREYNKSGI